VVFRWPMVRLTDSDTWEAEVANVNPDSKAFQALKKLREGHPHESREQIVERWVKLVRSDNALYQSMLREAFVYWTEKQSSSPRPSERH
jgi:hypothetical protein